VSEIDWFCYAETTSTAKQRNNNYMTQSFYSTTECTLDFNVSSFLSEKLKKAFAIVIKNVTLFLLAFDVWQLLTLTK